jgi:hypothetical protein
MNVENIRAAKARLTQTDETDLEVLTLAANRGFWRLFDGAVKEAESKGWIPLQNLPG